ncbi:MAG: hypothetical protein RL753_764, partial [Bacteroidota bacterium]
MASEGFDARSLALAKLASDSDLLSAAREQFRVLEVPVKDLTLGALAEVSLGQRDKMRARNMLVLGILTWMYSMPAEVVETELLAMFRG